MTKLTDEEVKSKAAFQLKSQLRADLLDVFDIHGMGIFIEGIVELGMELAIQYRKRVNGIDQPIDRHIARAKLRSRSKK